MIDNICFVSEFEKDMDKPENDVSDQQVSSSTDLDDLNFLHFPPEIDWSTTLVLRCDPAGAPYKLIDVANGLHFIVRRNDVHSLGHTPLNYAFTISFKTERSTENFVRYLKDRRNKPLTVKKYPCQVTRVPSKTVSINVRWVPADIDTVHITDVLKQYGKIVKTDLVRNSRPGWFHVYTGERRFKILLNDDVDVNALPYSLNIKGLYAAVYVEERNTKCLECYNAGHDSDTCKYKECILYKEE